MIFPVIKAIDVETAIDWYEHFLGFKCTYRSKIGEPEFAVIEKSKLKIYIQINEANSLDQGSLVIEVNDLEKSYSECDAAGVIFSSGIEKSEYGGQQFTIKDYDHNNVIFLNVA